MTREELEKGVSILEGAAKLRLSKDGMVAYLTDLASELDVRLREALPEVLKEAGIGFGVLPFPEPDGEDWVVARGRVPEDGEDARVQYAIDLPGKAEDGGEAVNRPSPGKLYLDPKDLHKIINVRAGQTLAEKLPPTPGTAGRNVLDEEVEANEGNWVAFVFGEGVESTEEDVALVATRDGKVQFREDGAVEVWDEWTLEGPVDATTGHVTFWGRKLVIEGSVHGGYRVQADGDLVVNGNLEDECHVSTGGNLTVSGIIRAGKTTVQVGGGLVCQAVEYAKVEAGGNIEVSDYVLDGRCQAGGDVVVVQGKGLIAGGQICAARSVMARVVGTPANVPTRVRAGCDPRVRQLYEKLVQEIEDLSKRHGDVEDGLLKLKVLEARGPLDEKRKEIRQRLLAAEKTLGEHLIKDKDIMKELDMRLALLQKAAVEIQDKAYPNTTVGIDQSVMELRHDVERARFVFRDGEIKVRPVLPTQENERVDSDRANEAPAS